MSTHICLNMLKHKRNPETREGCAPWVWLELDGDKTGDISLGTLS